MRRREQEYSKEREEEERQNKGRRAEEKQYMQEQIRKVQREKNKRAELLDRREFALNRKKLAEMGIGSIEEQEEYIWSSVH